jgi:hypothetical protein
MSIIIDGKEYFGIIYKIENIITHEIYIGQTTHPRGFNGRYDFKGNGIERVYKKLLGNEARGERHNQHLRRSIKKFGFDAFEVTEVFDTAETLATLNEKESYYINLFDSYKNGYNQSFGGDSTSGYSRPSGKDCPNSKRVCQISIDGQLIKIWDSATEASNELHITASSISNVCNGKIRRKGGEAAQTAGGYIWVFEKDYNSCKDYSIKRLRLHMGSRLTEVLLLSDDGDIVQEFCSMHEASRELGICVESVRKTCLHKIKNPRFNLIYKSEYMEEQRLSVRELCEEAS